MKNNKGKAQATFVSHGLLGDIFINVAVETVDGIARHSHGSEGSDESNESNESNDLTGLTGLTGLKLSDFFGAIGLFFHPAVRMFFARFMLWTVPNIDADMIIAAGAAAGTTRDRHARTTTSAVGMRTRAGRSRARVFGAPRAASCREVALTTPKSALKILEKAQKATVMRASIFADIFAATASLAPPRPMRHLTIQVAHCARNRARFVVGRRA